MFKFPVIEKLDMNSTNTKERNQKSLPRFHCSVVLTPKGFELVKEFAMHKNLNYPEAIEQSIQHCLNCVHKVPVKGD
jgi:hypothetical protein